MGNSIQEALRGTRDTIRYIGESEADSRRRIAESKLMNAQLEFKKEAQIAELENQREEQKLRAAKLKQITEENKPVKLRDIITINYGHNPEMLNKVIGSFEQTSPGYIDKEIQPKLAAEAFKAIAQQQKPVKQTSIMSPQDVISAGLREGTVAQVDETGKINVLQSPKTTSEKGMSTASVKNLRDVVIRSFSDEINYAAENKGATPEEVQANPELYFSKDNLDFFSSVEETAIALKQKNPMESDISIAKKAKKMVFEATGDQMVQHLNQITNPEERKAFILKAKSNPFSDAALKDAAARFDKMQRESKKEPQMGVSHKRESTKKAIPSIVMDEKKPDKKDEPKKKFGSTLLDKAREINKKLIRLKQHTRENPTF